MRSTIAKAICAALLLGANAARAHEDKPHNAPAQAAYDGHAAALGEPADPKARARVINVTMNDKMRFVPQRLVVKKGETIRLVVKNVGEVKHELVLGTMEELAEHAKVMQQHPEMEHDDPNAVTVEPGKTGTLTWKFTKDGEFDFACLIPGHLEGGMKGKVLVQR